jgi:hypothetical protein
VFRVGDQDDFRRHRPGARDLAEDAIGVQRGLAAEYAVTASLVDQHALAERVEVDAHDLGDQRPLHDARRAFAGAAQAQVLLLERFEAHQLEAQHQVVRGEPDVVGLDAGP